MPRSSICGRRNVLNALAQASATGHPLYIALFVMGRTSPQVAIVDQVDIKESSYHNQQARYDDDPAAVIFQMMILSPRHADNLYIPLSVAPATDTHMIM